MSDRDVFIISAVRSADPAQAIRQAVQDVQLNPGRVQDVLFGLESGRFLPYHGSSLPQVDEIVRKAGLTCPSAAVSSSLRAVFFAAQSILSGDVDLTVAVGLDGEDSAALLMASPDAVGRWNLSPRARLAARSLSGAEAALRAARLASGDVTILKEGRSGALLVKELLEELERRPAQWGMVSAGGSALLIERI